MAFWFTVLFGVVAFFTLWLVIMLIVSQVGWAKLAKHYGVRQPTVDGRRLRFQSIAVNGLAHYSGCVHIVVSQEGISLQAVPRWMFPFHQPIHIPWADMDVVHIQESRRFGNAIRGLILDIGRPIIARLQLPGKVLQLAQELRATATAADKQEEGT